MTKLESIKDTLKTIDYLKGATQEHYKNSIIGIICFEKSIIPNVKNWNTLESIYYKWFDSCYQLINELFNDNEYDLFNDEERELLGL